MARFRKALPQLGGDFFLTDGGIETTLIFLEGLELPHFAAFELLKNPVGEAALRKYFATYAGLAQRLGTGSVLESATWRASADWGAKLGYRAKEMADANRRAIRLLEDVRDEFKIKTTVISGCVGPRGDGYSPANTMSAKDAISFTVETDGRLPTGQTLQDAIEQVDAETSLYPAYYMINCAHPTHFEHVLVERAPWTERIRGLRANASRKSHAELNESPELDLGDPVELGVQHGELKKRLSHLNVMGGCCGTDHRHVEQIAMACSRSS
jgi:homocysteine S-methyltransferase